MIFNYLSLIFEVAAHAFCSFCACIILLPIASFLVSVALGTHDSLTAMLGLMAAGMTAIMAVVAVIMELAQAVEEVRSLRCP